MRPGRFIIRDRRENHLDFVVADKSSYKIIGHTDDVDQATRFDSSEILHFTAERAFRSSQNMDCYELLVVED